MDPRYLVHLAVIVDTGSLSRAAERLNVTQPTLTRTVKIIEDRTGSPVLKRERYGVTATALGDKLAQIGREIRRQSELSREIVGAWHTGLHGELSVGFGALLFQLLVTDLSLEATRAPWPYQVFFNSGLLGPMFRMLNEGSMDVVIGPDQVVPMGRKLGRIPLLNDELVVVIGAKSPLINKPTIEPNDLAEAPFVGAGTRTGMLTSDSLLMEQANIPTINPVTINGSSDRIVELMLTTEMCSVFPLEIWKAIAGAGNTCRIHKMPTSLQRPVAIWIRNGEEERPEVQHFIQRLKATVENKLPKHCLAFEASDA